MDEDSKIAGFIMHKLWSYHYVGGKHTSVDNLPKGYDPSERGRFTSVIKRLRKEGLIWIHPTGYGLQVAAVVQEKARALQMVNEFRASVELPALGPDFEEIASKAGARLVGTKRDN